MEQKNYHGENGAKILKPREMLNPGCNLDITWTVGGKKKSHCTHSSSYYTAWTKLREFQVCILLYIYIFYIQSKHNLWKSFGKNSKPSACAGCRLVFCRWLVDESYGSVPNIFRAVKSQTLGGKLALLTSPLYSPPLAVLMTVAYLHLHVCHIWQGSLGKVSWNNLWLDDSLSSSIFSSSVPYE